ncbi:hypothetical protein B0J11DRAFT_520943 [Dendryphion nanum]|uniref:Prolyl 4-hydroxylase alpha subunit domain-containing protein n=1 Tax=Dendryphion nanum TaxID=256645 RepID=A0A9P9E683_9PLEO|nr:hypothetical protein B0J11DRAFT_520943 [Dendryphion nanum]
MAALSFGTLIQYAVIALLGYILVGAPFSTVFSGSSVPSPRSQSSFDRVDSLAVPDAGLKCKDHGYRVHLFSREPLVIYIENFVNDQEAKHIVDMSEPKFQPSTVWTEGKESLNDLVRKSEKAQLDRDHVVQCVEERARLFQGWRPYVYIEKLWSQRYRKNGHYTYHYDWSTSTPTSGRISSFMVYLEANCTGGGTNFPRLQVPKDRSWCRFIVCDDDHAPDGAEDKVEGVIFKPITRNAVFWENIRSDGSGYTESWHAGLPVKEGTKIGLNIWSWYQEGLEVSKVTSGRT